MGYGEDIWDINENDEKVNDDTSTDGRFHDLIEEINSQFLMCISLIVMGQMGLLVISTMLNKRKEESISKSIGRKIMEKPKTVVKERKTIKENNLTTFFCITICIVAINTIRLHKKIKHQKTDYYISLSSQFNSFILYFKTALWNKKGLKINKI